MSFTRPTKIPRCATVTTTGYPGRVEPNEGKKDSGFDDDEAPPAGEHNWFFGLAGDWIEYLDAARDAGMARLRDCAMNPPHVGASTGGIAAAGGILTGVEVAAFAIRPSVLTGTNTRILATAYFSSGPVAAFLISDDWGSNWSLVSASPFTGRFSDALYANGLFVIVGQNGELQTSPDGVTFTRRVSGITGTSYTGIAYNAANGVWVVSAYGGQSIRSLDGISWSGIFGAGAPANASDVAAGGGVFVCATDAGLLTSVDGLTWTAVSAAAGESQTDSQGMTSVAYVGLEALQWVAARSVSGGASAAYVADDLTTGFQRRTQLENDGALRAFGCTATPWGAIVFGQHTSNAVRACYTSTDGTTWHRLFLPPAYFGGNTDDRDIEFLWDANRSCGALFGYGGGFATDISRSALVSI